MNINFFGKHVSCLMMFSIISYVLLETRNNFLTNTHTDTHFVLSHPCDYFVCDINLDNGREYIKKMFFLILTINEFCCLSRLLTNSHLMLVYDRPYYPRKKYDYQRHSFSFV